MAAPFQRRATVMKIGGDELSSVNFADEDEPTGGKLARQVAGGAGTLSDSLVSRETTTEVRHQRQKSKDSDSSHMYVVGPLDTDMSGDTQLIKTDPFQ